jgi:hypothetical protein
VVVILKSVNMILTSRVEQSQEETENISDDCIVPDHSVLLTTVNERGAYGCFGELLGSTHDVIAFREKSQKEGQKL